MKRGKDKKKRQMRAASLANLKPLDKVKPDGMDSVLVRVYLPPAAARAWRRLTPTERGEWVQTALEMRSKG